MSVFTLNIDVDNKKIVPGRSGGAYKIPTLGRSDTATFRLGFLRQVLGQYRYLDFSDASIKFGIGQTAATPTEGQFYLTFNSLTSTAISYNATTSQIINALASVVSVSVTTVGNIDSSWYITTTSTGIFSGTTAGFGGNSNSLYPSSNILISTDRAAAPGVSLRQNVRLVQSPAAYQDSWSNTSTAGGGTITLSQVGSPTQSEIYVLEINPDVYSGQYVLTFGSQSVGLPFDASSSQIESELSKLSGIGNYLDAQSVTRPNVKVDGANGRFGITFVGNLSNTNIVSAFTINDSALVRPPFKYAGVTINTSAINYILNQPTIPVIYCEIDITQEGKQTTILSTPIEISTDEVISTGSAVPADTAQYYTKSESNSLFISNTTSNIDSTNRRLKNSSGTTIIDYQNALLGSGGMIDLSSSVVTIGSPIYANSSITAAGAVSFGGEMYVKGNLGFYGTTPIAKPNGNNAISSVVSLGLISATATIGVLPQSIKTLTTTASIWFGGSINSNDFHTTTVAVTGASINDIILLGLPSVVCGGLFFTSHITSADTVSINAQNTTNGAINPATATYRITVIGY